MTHPFSPYAEDATDEQILTMPDCEACGSAIPEWREPFCRPCFLKRTQGLCLAPGCHTMLRYEDWELGYCPPCALDRVMS